MMLVSKPFVVANQVKASVLCFVGFWAFYFVIDQIVATS
jgi:hypothetical protein